MVFFVVSSHDAIYLDVLSYMFAFVGDVGSIGRLSAVCKVFRQASRARLRIEFPLVKPETPIRWGNRTFRMKEYISGVISDHQTASIKFFCENKLDLSENLLDIVEVGTVAMLEVAMRHRPGNLEPSKRTSNLVNRAVEKGRPDMVDFLYRNYRNELSGHSIPIWRTDYISFDMSILLARWSRRGSVAQEWAQEHMDDLSVDLRRTKTIGLNRRRTALQPGSTRHVRAPFKPPRKMSDFR